MSAGGADKGKETVVIEDDTIPDPGADKVVPDTTGAGNMGAEIETTRTPDTPESSQQQPPASQQQTPPQQQQQTPPQQQQQQQPEQQQQQGPTKPRQQTPPPALPTSQPPPSKAPVLKPVPAQQAVLPKETTPTLARPNPGKQLTLHASPSKGVISLSKTVKIIPAASSFVMTKTPSRNNLGYLGHYSMDWNNADVSEVTSGNPEPRPHPAGPSNLAQKMHAAKVAIVEADKAALVSTYLISSFTFLSTYTHISSSPRDSGRVLLGLKL
jgi:hypothetical protein